MYKNLYIEEITNNIKKYVKECVANDLEYSTTI